MKCETYVNIGRSDERKCGEEAHDTCDYCHRAVCDEHMEIPRTSKRNYGRTMCSTLKHS